MITKHILKMNLANRTLQRATTLRHLSAYQRIPKVKERINLACNQIVNSKTTLKDFLNESIPTENKWDQIRKQLSNSNISQANTVDSLIINVCSRSSKKPDFAMQLVESYLNYLRKNNHEVNIAVANRTMNIFKTCQDKIKHEELIIWLYDNVYKKYPVLDTTSATVLVEALCGTQRWQEAEAYLDLCYTSGKLAFVAACFRNNQGERGWKSLDTVKEDAVGMKLVEANLITEFLRYCKRNFEGEALHQAMSTFATFFRETGSLFNPAATKAIVEYAPTINYTAKEVIIPRNGICPNCKRSLMKAEISEEEYIQLQKYTLEKIVVAQDIYKGTSPKELANFIEFVNNDTPYDCVVDGLNLYYKCLPENIMPVLMQLTRSKKVLIISRRHLKKTFKKYEEDPNVSIYFVDDLTKDDAFILYAALKSGRNCKIVTNDFMRAESYSLANAQLRSTFKMWQVKNHLLARVCDRTKRVFIQPLIKFPVLINEDPEGWHIPWSTKETLPDIFRTWDDWICLRK